MSSRVLIITEDFRLDSFMLHPLIQSMMQALGRSKTKVVVCRDPLLRGVNEALRWSNIEEILLRYRGLIDLFVLCVDRDGKAGREPALRGVEETVVNSGLLNQTQLFIGVCAHQEIEVWLLAAQRDLPSDWEWRQIRAEIHPKETYFEPYVNLRGLQRTMGKGRKKLGIEAGRNYTRIRQLCPEIAALEARVAEWL